jgi:hypothetical protein
MRSSLMLECEEHLKTSHQLYHPLSSMSFLSRTNKVQSVFGAPPCANNTLWARPRLYSVFRIFPTGIGNKYEGGNFQATIGILGYYCWNKVLLNNGKTVTAETHCCETMTSTMTTTYVMWPVYS